MFVVTLTYLVPLHVVDDALAEHVAWLDRQYADGVLLANGPRVPREGGVVLASGVTRADLDRRLADDPFARQGLARHEVVEFTPSRVARGAESWLGEAPAGAAGTQPRQTPTG